MNKKNFSNWILSRFLSIGEMYNKLYNTEYLQLCVQIQQEPLLIKHCKEKYDN